MKKKIGKRIVSLALTTVMVISLVVGCGEKESDAIKLGGVFPLTGDVPALGAAMENGAKLAIKEINEAGGVLDKQIEFIVEDDQNQAATAPNAITKLIEQDKVTAVIGTYASKCSIPMSAIAKEAEVVMITPGSTNEKVTLEGGEYVFRACFIDPYQGKVGAKFASESLGAKKAAMLYDVGNDYCVGIAGEFKSNFEATGGSIAYEETYNTGESDFKAFLTEIKELGVDVLYLPDNYSTVGLIAKQAREIGIECPFLGSDSWSDPGLIEVGGDAIEGAYFTDHVSLKSDKEAVQKFVAAYQAEYNEEPSAFSVLSYDSVYLVVEAIKNAGSTEEAKIKDALAAIDMDCVSGKITFDENRNPIKSAVINKVENGEFIFESEIAPE
jgi:branched-chain amino acid transport system substrate-binding protein